MADNVILVGFMGAGKSSVGRLLARRLGRCFVETDDMITASEGCSIPEIFARDGESAFRRLECEVLADLLSRDRLVIAAGGGAVLDESTRRRMQDAGPVVWLQAAFETIWQRIAASVAHGGSRPALTRHDPQTEASLLLRQREPVYAATAAIAVKTDDRPVDEIVAEIVAALRLAHEPCRIIRLAQIAHGGDILGDVIDAVRSRGHNRRSAGIGSPHAPCERALRTVPRQRCRLCHMLTHVARLRFVLPLSAFCRPAHRSVSCRPT